MSLNSDAVVVEDGDGRRELDQRRRTLRDELHVVSAERSLLLDVQTEEHSYRAAASTQVSRLASIELIPQGTSGDESSTHCPLCSSELAQADASPDELRTSLEELRGQLEGLDAVQPTRAPLGTCKA